MKNDFFFVSFITAKYAHDSVFGYSLAPMSLSLAHIRSYAHYTHIYCHWCCVVAWIWIGLWHLNITTIYRHTPGMDIDNVIQFTVKMKWCGMHDNLSSFVRMVVSLMILFFFLLFLLLLCLFSNSWSMAVGHRMFTKWIFLLFSQIVRVILGILHVTTPIN